MKPETSRAVRVVTTVLTPSPENREEFVQTLRSLRGDILRQPGCLLCAVCRDIDGGDSFVLVSEWRDQPALMAHMASEQFRILSGASRLLGASAEFRFITSSTTEERAG